MPRNPNRRTIEVAADTYEHLRARAEERGDSIAGVVRMLLIDGQTVQDWHTAHDAMLRDVRDRVRDLAADVRDLAARVPAAPAPGGEPEPPAPAPKPPRRRSPHAEERDRHRAGAAADVERLGAPVAPAAAPSTGGEPESSAKRGGKRRPRWDREPKNRARSETIPTLFDAAASEEGAPHP